MESAPVADSFTFAAKLFVVLTASVLVAVSLMDAFRSFVALT
jgi:hypothetical protein